jgi:hypothetical protein
MLQLHKVDIRKPQISKELPGLRTSPQKEAKTRTTVPLMQCADTCTFALHSHDNCTKYIQALHDFAALALEWSRDHYSTTLLVKNGGEESV